MEPIHKLLSFVVPGNILYSLELQAIVFGVVALFISTDRKVFRHVVLSPQIVGSIHSEPEISRSYS